jgi:hypothetical protein
MALGALLPLGGAAGYGTLPRLVFVSRGILPDALAGAVPGLGPHHRLAAPGGRLLVRETDGRVRPLLTERAFHDVSDPSVSWDGKRIAFAGVVAPDSAWRIWVVNADGTGLRPWTLTDGRSTAPTDTRYDDFDPCWLPDDRLCFATTRYREIAQRGRVPTSNLFVVDGPGARPIRITSERNGAEEPTVDLKTGRIVYARWWFNRYLASEQEQYGVTTAAQRAVPADSVNIWHAISITLDGDGGKLAGGFPRVRAQTMAYQPVVLRDGTLIGVQSENLGLSPEPGALQVNAFPGGFAEPVVLAGGPRGGSACSPAPLPDGRVVLSLDRTRNGDRGLFVVRLDGSGLVPVLDLPGTAELDAVLLAPHPRPPLVKPEQMENPRQEPVTKLSQLEELVVTFRFDCMNVFGTGPVDSPFPDAPAADQGVRIRFYATLSRPEAAAGDTVVLLKEAPVNAHGGVHEDDMPADTPMFEQLVDAHGHVLRSPMGPAHVSGLNAGRFGTGTKCQGCHIGHSAIAVPSNYSSAQRFNLSPSAQVEASSLAEGGAGARAAVDRLTRGPALQVAWVADRAEQQSLKLSWRYPIEVDTLVLYSPSPDPREGTDLRVQQCQVALYREGRLAQLLTIGKPLSPKGTRIPCGGVRVDSLRVSPTRVTGRVGHKHVAALAEVETIARLVED